MKIIEFKKILEKNNKRFLLKIKAMRNYYTKRCSQMTLKEVVLMNKQYRNLLYKLIKSVINDVNRYEKVDFGVFLSGSLARKTNTLFSDIDINYVIKDNKYYDKIIELEGKINYLLKEIIGFRGKDRIHSMVVYMPLISDKKLAFIKKNKYPLLFEDGIIYDTCRKNAEKLMFETYNSTRNIYNIVDYYNEYERSSVINEWLYCVDFIYGKEIEKIFKKNRIILKKNITNEMSNIILDDINKDYKFIDASIRNVKICDLKNVYKSKVYNNFYNILAIDYKCHNLKKFDIESIYKSSLRMRTLIKKYYNYVKSIQKLEMELNNLGFDLSGHSDYCINVYNFKYIIKELNIKKEILYKECIIYLKEDKDDR